MDNVTSTCPMCGKPTISSVKPFCSKRCADVDLGRWVTGTYRIPTPFGPEDEDADSDKNPHEAG